MKASRGALIISVLFIGIIAAGVFAYAPYIGERLAALGLPIPHAWMGHGEPAATPAKGHTGHTAPTDTAAAAAPAAEEYYTCPMHPQVQADKPGRCTICGMDLVLRKRQDAKTIFVDEKMRRLIGIVTAVVSRESVGAEIRTVGRIEVNERKLVHVPSRVQGWVEDLAVDFAGQSVKKGEPLLTIYSPELLSTEEEYLIALEAEERLRDSTDPDAAKSGMGLLAAARRRLSLYNVPESEIARLHRTRVAKRSITLHAPTTGTVTEIDVRRDMEVTPSMRLYTIADLSTVWLTADLYDNEIGSVAIGQEAEITVKQLPSERFHGRVEYIYPYLNAEARTNRVRITLANTAKNLKPGMYADVKIRETGEMALTIPVDAVVRTGMRDVVYVENKDGSFSPREVELGAQRGDRYIVLNGLMEGEKVVSAANYFLDSEATIRSAGAAPAHKH